MNEPKKIDIEISRAIYDSPDEHKSKFIAKPGLNEEIVRLISKTKNEPEWMLQKRLQGLKLCLETPMPEWGPDLSKLDLNNIIYFIDPNTKETNNWEEVPEEIKKTFDRLGIPEAEKNALGGVGAQYDSSVIYHNIEKSLKEKGVVFENMDVAVHKYPELVKKYFMTSCIPVNDHKFIMLHAAVWSGGTFIYVPKNVKVDLPLQAYFRMNAQKGGQFEHTLIIVDEGSELQYIEGCFTRGNIVTSNPNYKLIETIKEGEKVLTHDGSYKKIKQVYQMPFTGTVKKINLSGTIDNIEVTNDHPFLYVDKKHNRERNKEWDIRWNTPQFFKKGDYLVVPINKTIIKQDFYEVEIDKWNNTEKEFQKIKKRIPSTKEFFKLAGYYLAEGSISGGHYLNFSFSSKERTLIEDVKSLLKTTFGIEKTLEMVHKKNNGTSIVVCSTELCKVFERFGKKANLKEIPHWMMLEDPKKQKYIIEGYYKGDGNYYNKRVKSGALKEVIRINSVSQKLMRQCKDILLRLGIVPFINSRDRTKEGRQTMYTLGITGDHMIKLGSILSLNIEAKLLGKHRGSRFGINDNFAFYPIREIETREANNEDVYNFAVEDNETYCVAGAAAHNCSSPSYTSSSLHAGCVELHVLPGAKMRYSSIENWSKNVYNLNTKRAIVHKNASVEWINGNMGSQSTMLYPCSILVGEGARSESLGIAFAGPGQDQDTGSKVIHAASNTTSIIKAKSISKGGGISTYRGLVKVLPNAKNVKSNVKCDALIVDNKSVSRTFPYNKIENNQVNIGHEATVGKIADEQIFYLMSRGISKEQAIQMIVSGFIEPIVKALPLEYAVELNKLIEMEMEGF